MINSTTANATAPNTAQRIVALSVDSDTVKASAQGLGPAWALVAVGMGGLRLLHTDNRDIDGYRFPDGSAIVFTDGLPVEFVG